MAPGTRDPDWAGETGRHSPSRNVGWVRSEGDSWDITTTVGSTALFLATARPLEAQKPDPLAVDPYAELFCRAVGGPSADVLDGKDRRLVKPEDRRRRKAALSLSQLLRLALRTQR